MRRSTCLTLFSMPLLAACASPRPVERVIVLPSERLAGVYEKYQYAPAVRAGETVFVSGIPASQGETYEEKARSAFIRLGEVLRAAGASFDDVVEITTFHAQARDSAAFGEEFAKLLAIHREFFKHGYPAWTAVGTTALLSPGAPFEMRAVAVIGAGRRTRIERTYEKRR